jgi:RNA polymerase sigma factor (sigma-70 family)
MRDDLVVITLVARARDGDQHAWNEIVDRYAPLVWSICKRYELSRHDIDDISQTVWLLLVAQLGNLRQPAALAGWLATTTHRECLRVIRAATRYDLSRSPGDSPAPRDRPPAMIDQEVIAAELRAALRAASGPPPETAVPAAQRASDLLRGDQRPAPHPHREHRPAACPMPRPAAPLSLPRGLHRQRPPNFRRRERPLQGTVEVCAECLIPGTTSSSWLR